MECRICKKDNKEEKHIYDNIGPVCKPCDETGYPRRLSIRFKKFIKSKKLGSYPDDMEMHDFEVMIRQISYVYLDDPEFRKQMKEHEVNPILYIPAQFALHIKEGIIKILPDFLVKTWHSKGADRWFSGGEFRFVDDKIPKSMVLEKLEELGIPFPAMA